MTTLCSSPPQGGPRAEAVAIWETELYLAMGPMGVAASVRHAILVAAPAAPAPIAAPVALLAARLRRGQSTSVALGRFAGALPDAAELAENLRTLATTPARTYLPPEDPSYTRLDQTRRHP